MKLAIVVGHNSASTIALTAIGGMGGTDALWAMGLTRIGVEV